MMKEKFLKEIMEWIKVIAIALVLSFVITSFVKPTLVNGESMLPTLEPKDYMLVNKMAYKSSLPAYGDIIVFESDLEKENGGHKDLVKRVIAVEGDHIVVSNGQVWRNDELLEEDYILEDMTVGEVDMIVPEGHVFAMGDNRQNSTDSRDSLVGPVPVQNIMGKVFIRLFPFNRITTDFS